MLKETGQNLEMIFGLHQGMQNQIAIKTKNCNKYQIHKVCASF